MSARKVVGVLIDYMDSWQAGYETQLRNAFQAESHKLGLNLLVVVGRAVEHPDPASRAQNDIYRLLHADCVDALILASGGLAAYMGAGALERFAKSLPRVPLCSVGLEVPNVPSVMVENRSGMTALMDHLLREHGRRQVAFIGGPRFHPEAVVRRQIFERELRGRGLKVDARLMVDAQFTRHSGMDAMKQILASNVPFDAVVAANDAMALGAMDVLKSNGLRVPKDVAVTGFDDLQLSRYAAVPLTTVRQPVEYMATVALQSVYRQMQGESVELSRRLIAEFVQRQSCGCVAHRAPHLESSMPSGLGPARFVDRHALELIELLTCEVVLPLPDDNWAGKLIKALKLELTGTDDVFVSALEDLLNSVGRHDELYDEFQLVITLLREALGEVSTPELEDLWHTARRVIALASIRNQTGQRMDAEASYQRLLNTGERFTAALNRDALLHAFAEELPRLNATDVFISLFADAARTQLTPFFWMRRGKVMDLPEQSFPATHLIPDAGFLRDGARTAFAFPLTFESETLGVVVFGEGAGVYEMLREQISAAIKVHALHQEIVRQTALHERSAQERLATAERIHSLSVLAGGVAHDLNNALGPLVGLPDLILGDLVAIEGGDKQRLAQVREDLEMIKHAAQRAALTIKDLLTLGRRGNALREPLELNEVIHQCIASEPLQRLAEEARVGLQVQLQPVSLGMLGSEPHLVRAISNLVRNALEATSGGGQVTLTTAAVSLDEAKHGYETVEAGTYAVLTVKDTGHGMSREDLARAFEPFFSKKRFAGKSGSGLGLAIVHAVVKEHGGFIHVESALGEGTRFTVYFPKVAVTPSHVPSVTQPPRGGGRLLVIDDEPAQLRTAERTLTSLGYNVDTSSSGTHALGDLGLESDAQPEVNDGYALGPAEPGTGYDLILCDVVLGETNDGIDLLRKVLRSYPHQKTLIVSGYASDERRRAAEELGIPWVSKPYTAQILADAVSKVLKGS